MKNFQITFGTGNDSMTIVSDGANAQNAIELLKSACWETESITEIKEI
jgi:hypothetical protein